MENINMNNQALINFFQNNENIFPDHKSNICSLLKIEKYKAKTESYFSVHNTKITTLNYSFLLLIFWRAHFQISLYFKNENLKFAL